MKKRTNRFINLATYSKTFFMFLLTIFLSAHFTESYALVFNIVPNGTLPTSVPIGGSVPASYIIQNHTTSQRNNNFIKYLPPNVSIANGGCGSHFNLAPFGSPGDSCILNLSVKGAINANDPNPHHHLFACFPGGITCAGTAYPLNVQQKTLISISITPVNATVSTGTTQQYKAIAHYSDGSTSNITSSVTWQSSNTTRAKISKTGLATGQSVGSVNITATSGSITSNTAHLVVTALLYAANFGSDTVSFCVVNADGSLGPCNTTGNAINDPAGIVLNGTQKIIYVTNFNDNTVVFCPVNANGTLGTCNTTGNGFITPAAVKLNPPNTVAYVPNITAGNVSFCPVNANGSFGTCTLSGNIFSGPSGVVINSENTIAYVVNNGSGTVSLCTLNSGDGSFDTCTTTATGFVNPTRIDLNNDNTFAYIANFGNSTVSVCPINPDGTFGTCSTTGNGFSGPAGIVLNNDNTFCYVSNNTASTISVCPVNPDGTFGTCITSGTGFDEPIGLTIQRKTVGA